MKPHTKIIDLIQNVLSPDLIGRTWQKQTKERPLSGYCYIASEAFYYLEAKELGYKPAQMWVHVGNGTEISHWFLRRQSDGDIVDITAAQFGKIRIPYHQARSCGFLTNFPSDGAAEIMRRIEES